MINKQTDWLSLNQPIGSNWMKTYPEIWSSTHQFFIFFQTTLGCQLDANLCCRQVSIDGRMHQDLREILQAGGFGGLTGSKIEVIVMDIC